MTRYLTLIEPFESERMVKHAEATGPDSLRVELADGRVQEIDIRNLEGSGNDIAVTLTEHNGDQLVATETTAAQ